MTQSTDPSMVTTSTLLAGLRDFENDQCWTEFVERVEPVLLGVARRAGLKNADAYDAAQDALWAFADDIRAGKYDRERGRLRAWLIGILGNRIRRTRERYVRSPLKRGSSFVDERVSDADLDLYWEQERQAIILHRARQSLAESSGTSEQTVEIFNLLFRYRGDAGRVAEHLNVTRDVVYQARSRMVKRLRETVAQIEEQFDDL